MVSFSFLIDFDSRKGTRVCVFWHTFLIFVRPWSARVSLKVPWLVLALLLAPVWLLWNLFGSFLVPFWHRKPSTERERERERESKRERNIFCNHICLHTRFCSLAPLAGGRRPPRCGCTFTSCNHQNTCTSALEIDRAHVTSWLSPHLLHGPPLAGLKF